MKNSNVIVGKSYSFFIVFLLFIFSLLIIHCFFCRLKSKEKTTTSEIEKTTQETTQETTREIILKLIKNNPTITGKELAEKTGLTTDGVKYHLNKLREQGVIKHVGATKKGYWEIRKGNENNE